MLFTQGETISWVLVVSGILLVVEGIMVFADCKERKKLKWNGNENERR